MTQQPNFLVIVTDEQRRDTLGCYGNPICRTPNIDALADQGVRFDNCFVQNPICMPSRSTLMTGQYPSSHGVRSNGINLSEDIPKVTTLLASAGYQTASFGKIHLNSWGGAEFERFESRSPPRPKTVESRGFWRSHDHIPTPYMGFQTVEIACGHNETFFGDYVRWLKSQNPEAFELMQFDCALDLPSGAIRTWNSALPVELHCTNWVADRTIDYLSCTNDKPFLVFCSFPDPHPSFCPPSPYCYMYDVHSIGSRPRRDGEFDDMPPHFKEYFEGRSRWLHQMFRAGAKNAKPANQHSDFELRDMVAHYWGMVSLVDDAVGRVVSALDLLGLREDTVVVFLSDHGDLMGDHGLIMKGAFHYDGLLRVPLIWNSPGLVPPGRKSDALVGLIDIAPTILSLAGVEKPAMQGLSLADYLTGGAFEERQAILTENDDEYVGLLVRTLTTREWKLTRYAGRPHGELFDRRNDPDELRNLWSATDHRKIRDELTELMIDEMLRAAPIREPRFAIYD